MKVHHLNCGTMRLRVPGAMPLVCHVLLVETGDGLVLVDSGFGLSDIADPARRLGFVRHVVLPALNPDETAVRQVDALGFTPADVRHIVVTHFDLDHVGGLADFPHADVHVTVADSTRGLEDLRRHRTGQHRLHMDVTVAGVLNLEL